MHTSLSIVGFIWAVTSVVSSISAFIGFYFPYWLRGTLPLSGIPTYFGLFRRCNYIISTSGGSAVNSSGLRVAEECGRYAQFTDIPSVWWQIGTVVTGVGCALAIMIAFGALVCCCTSDTTTGHTAIFAGGIQFFAVVCLSCGCLLHPLGWDNPEVQQACGTHSKQFRLGDCTLFWAYYTLIAGIGGTFLSSLLACMSAKNQSGYQKVLASIPRATSNS